MRIALLFAFSLSCLTAQEAPAPGFDVVVTTPDGKPARGAPLGVGRAGKECVLAAVGVTTDKQGRARVAVDPALGLGRDVAIGVLGAFASPCQATVDLLLPPTEPIALTVPVSGQVRFILYGRDERPTAGLLAARLSLADRGPAVDALALATDNALFPWVQVGMDLAVTVRCRDVVGELVFRTKGPKRAGEFAIVEGRLGAGPPLFALQVLDADGAPVADEDVGVVLRGPSIRFQGVQRTDAAGGLLVAAGEASGKARDLHVLRRGPGDPPARRGALHVKVDAPATGVVELGGIRLADEPVVLRGRVVDADGKPLPGVVLRGALSFAGRDAGAMFEHRVTSDADGWFELCERDPAAVPTEFAVASPEWTSPTPLLLQPGAPPPAFALLPTSEIALTMAGADTTRLDFDVRLVHRGTGHATYTRLRDGVLAPVRVIAGTYDITIGDHGVEFAILAVEAPAGDRAADPRLLAVAPPAELQVLRVRVCDERGVPVPDISVWCMGSPKAVAGRGARTDARGRTAFLAPRTAGRVAVRELGFDPIEQPFAPPENEVLLQRVAPLAVRFAALPQLPDGCTWTVVFTEPGEGNRTVARATVHDGIARFQPTRLGTWRAQLCVDTTGQLAAGKNMVAVRRLMELTRNLGIRFEVEAGKVVAPPKPLELTAEQTQDLADRADGLRALYEAAKDK